MPSPIFFDLGYPFASSEDMGLVFDLGYPFFSPGGLDPLDTRVLINLTKQGVFVRLGNPANGFYYMEVPTERDGLLRVIEVPAQDITGEASILQQNGWIDILLEANPPAIPDDILLTPSERRIQVRWTNPSDLDFERVRVIRTLVGPATSHIVSMNAANQQAQQVFERIGAPLGVLDTFEDVGLVNGTTYFYTLFVRDVSGFWSTTVTPGDNSASAVPLDSTGPQEVGNLTATSVTVSATTPGVRLDWTHPSDLDLAESMVRRSVLLVVDAATGTGDITFVQGSQFILVPTDLVIANTVGDFVLGPDGRSYEIANVLLGSGQVEIASLYLGPSLVTPVLNSVPADFPAGHLAATLVADLMSPTPGQSVTITDFDGNPYPGVGLPSGYYAYAVFSKDVTGNWNDNLGAGNKRIGRSI